jgi:hypothetical protein
VHGHFRSPLTGVDLIVHTIRKVRTRNCATSSWLAPASECGSDDWRHAADSSRTRGGSSAHREGGGCRPEHQTGADELLWCAPQSHVGQTSLAATDFQCARAMGKNISRPKQVTDWVARLP